MLSLMKISLTIIRYVKNQHSSRSRIWIVHKQHLLFSEVDTSIITQSIQNIIKIDLHSVLCTYMNQHIHNC